MPVFWMWDLDYPHLDSTWPYSQDVLDEIFESVPAEDRRKITHDNVKALYGI